MKPGPQVLESQIGRENPGLCPCSSTDCLRILIAITSLSLELEEEAQPSSSDEEATLSLFCLRPS